MALPDGFQWTTANRLRPGGADVLTYRGCCVAQLLQRADTGAWLARLDVHLERDARMRLRPCSARDAGRRGIQAWAQRHAQRLVREVQQAQRLHDATRISLLQASLRPHGPPAR